MVQLGPIVRLSMHGMSLLNGNILVTAGHPDHDSIHGKAKQSTSWVRKPNF